MYYYNTYTKPHLAVWRKWAKNLDIFLRSLYFSHLYTYKKATKTRAKHVTFLLTWSEEEFVGDNHALTHSSKLVNACITYWQDT